MRQTCWDRIYIMWNDQFEWSLNDSSCNLTLIIYQSTVFDMGLALAFCVLVTFYLHMNSSNRWQYIDQPFHYSNECVCCLHWKWPWEIETPAITACLYISFDDIDKRVMVYFMQRNEIHPGHEKNGIGMPSLYMHMWCIFSSNVMILVHFLCTLILPAIHA